MFRRRILTRRKQDHPRRPRSFEQLESRQLLAADLSIVDVQIVNRDNEVIDIPIVGQRYSLRASWEAEGLTNSDEYIIRYEVDGVALDSSRQTGATGDGSYFWYIGDWYALPGEHQVRVRVDGADELAESNESNNVLTFAFEPFEPPSSLPSLRTPIEGTPHVDWTISNYADVDATDGVSDPRGGSFTYDSHNAIDYLIPSFAVMDRGVDVLAAADGTVTAVRDGQFDRCTRELRDRDDICEPEDANYVTIDHGDGWTTQYLHFRKNSIVVNVGQTVSAGQRLGLVGSSGFSDAAHLHFELRFENEPIATLAAPSTYWDSPVDYTGDRSGFLASGILDYAPTLPEVLVGPESIDQFQYDAESSVYAWVQLFGTSDDDLLRFIWRDPNGVVQTDRASNPGNIGVGWRWSQMRLPANAELGRWSVEVQFNGTTWLTEYFQVANRNADSKSRFGLRASDGAVRHAKLSTGTNSTDEIWAGFDASDYMDVVSGDFNGDGQDEVIGRSSASGDLVVAEENRSRVVGKWSSRIAWQDVRTLDVNGDGRDDLLGRVPTNGAWWVALAGDSEFTNQRWGQWTTRVAWQDIVSGDFDGDGDDDLAGRAPSGQWWVSLASDDQFVTEAWGRWSPRIQWLDVRVGDINGDGQDDILGRASSNGTWWAAESSSSAFTNQRWGQWSSRLEWSDVQLADFSGDGRLDIAGRLGNGQWWLAVSDGSQLNNSAWIKWSAAVDWQGVDAFDVNGDRSADLVGLDPRTGFWWTTVSTSNGPGGSERLGQWPQEWQVIP